MNKECNGIISVILPVFNAGKYLEKCLDSILEQTYTKLEVICIDDGSTDGSELLADAYGKKDARIKVIHKKNGGESSARNVGLQTMTGEYVAFIDCDDWIEPKMYESMVSAFHRYNVDMVAATWFREEGSSSEKIKNRGDVLQGVFGREELLTYIYRRDAYQGFAYMWNKLYRRELFYEKCGRLMFFDEDLALGGDVLYLAKLAFHTQRVCYIDEAFYHYMQREDSGCHTKDLKKREDWLEAYKRILRYIAVNKIETGSQLWIKRFLAYHSSNVAVMAYEQNNEDVLLRCKEIMREYAEEYYATNQEYSDRIKRYKDILLL